MLPQAGEEPVAHQGNVVRPSGILREYPLFGTDAAEQGCPPHHHQKRCAEIPFLEVALYRGQRGPERYGRPYAAARAFGRTSSGMWPDAEAELGEAADYYE